MTSYLVVIVVDFYIRLIFLKYLPIRLTSSELGCVSNQIGSPHSKCWEPLIEASISLKNSPHPGLDAQNIVNLWNWYCLLVWNAYLSILWWCQSLAWCDLPRVFTQRLFTANSIYRFTITDGDRLTVLRLSYDKNVENHWSEWRLHSKKVKAWENLMFEFA